MHQEADVNTTLRALTGPTVEGRKLERDHRPTHKPKIEGKPAEIILHPSSNFWESTVPSPEVYSGPRSGSLEEALGPYMSNLTLVLFGSSMLLG